MRPEEAARARGAGEVGVETEDDIGLAALAFKPDAGEERRAVAGGDELQVAGAGCLERLFDSGARAPVGDEAVVGVDCQDGHLLRDGRRDGQKP